MRKLKSFLSILVVVALMFSFVGCGSNNKTETTNENTVTQGASDVTTQEATAAPTQAAVAEEPTYDYGGQVVKVYKGAFDAMKGDNPEQMWLDSKAAVEKKYNIVLEPVDVAVADGSNEYDEIVKSVAAGQPVADLISIGRDFLAQMVMNDCLEDLSDTIGNLKFASRYTDHGLWLGKYWGVGEYNVGACRTITYDRDLIQQAGMTKTPTQMFMEGKWSYADFKQYLTDLKAKLPEGVYPCGFHPYHWAIFAAAANGVTLVDDNGKLNTTSDAFTEAMNFYQELLQEGLAKPATVDADGNYTWSYTLTSEVAMTLQEDWQLEGNTCNWGVTLMPWGSNVTVSGDYTTLSDKYHASYNNGGLLVVTKGAPDRTGIPEDVLLQIAWDYHNADGRLQYMKDFYEQDQSGDKSYNAYKGMARSFTTEEDITLYDWMFSRAKFDNVSTLENAGLVDLWDPACEVFEKYSDVRSTFEAQYNVDKAALETAGFPQN
ncbi:MAG TPA: extracellular solute-binding protein [Mobilitalea sp.]|nr:extracellular solute-binding protein [Mobilitalea sp.]